MTDRALRLPDALEKTGESRTSFYRRIQAGIYPQPIPDRTFRTVA